MIEKRNAREAAKLEALQEATRVGFADLDEGRYRDIAEDDLGIQIGGLGRQAGERLPRIGR
jgi:antitoxin ParD1/3/4